MMKFRSKIDQISLQNFCKLEHGFCKLRTSCKLSSLIYMGFLGNGSSHAEVRSELPQSGNIINKSMTYVIFKFACRTLSLRERDKPRLRGFNSLTQNPLAVGSIGEA